MKVVDKEGLINMLENMSYGDDFLVTIEEIDDVFGKYYFLKIVTEELSEREVHLIKQFFERKENEWALKSRELLNNKC